MTNFEIEVGGKTFAFNVGILFLGQYINKSGKQLDELFDDIQKNTFIVVPDLMYESAKYKNPKLKESRSEFYDLIDKDGIELKSINEFIEKLTVSLTKDVPQEDEVLQGDDAKKK